MYDLAVVGGGPGGYVAAIKASQLGLKTVCVDNRGTPGGTCLNVGCIPSKAILNISHKYHEVLHDFPKMGLEVDAVNVNIEKMMAQKEKVVKGLTAGIEGLLKRNKCTYIKGFGKLTSANTIEVTPTDGTQTHTLDASNILVATGSEATPFPGGAIIIDEERIVTSTGALALKEVPKKMVILGGGVIGLELGSVWKRLGAEVEVVELLDRITPALDGEVGKSFQKILEKQGMKFHLGQKVTSANVSGDTVSVNFESAKDSSKKSSIECDILLVAIGRRPYTAGLGLQDLGIETDKAGRIVVGEGFCVPKYPSIRAIGDCIEGPMLAHKAEEEGIAAVELISNKGPGHVNYDAIPNVVYTHPEVAGVGKTEEELKASNIKYSKGNFPFAANSRARTNDDFDGFVKILTETQSDRILGAWVMGANAGELIHEIVVGIEYGAASEDIARTCHAHPTLSEAIKEACMAAHGKPIHFG